RPDTAQITSRSKFRNSTEKRARTAPADRLGAVLVGGRASTGSLTTRSKTMAEKTEAMVLQDGDGAYYAIPLDDVEAYRVADDKQDAVAEAVGADEVSGLSTINTTRSNI